MSNVVKIVSVEKNDEFVQLINEYVARMIAEDKVQPGDYPDECDHQDDLDQCNECGQYSEILDLFYHDFVEDDEFMLIGNDFVDMATYLYETLSGNAHNRDIVLTNLLKARDAAFAALILENMKT